MTTETTPSASPTTTDSQGTTADNSTSATQDSTTPAVADTGAETKSTETKPEEGKSEEAPAEFEPKLPEGMQPAGELLDALKSAVKEGGLKGESAQKLVDTYVAAQANAREQAIEKWETELKADKEIGGAKWGASKVAANKALDKFGSPQLREFLETSGLGSHPELVKALVKVGKAFAEDSIAGTSGTPGRELTQEDRLRLAYPTMYQNQKE